MQNKIESVYVIKGVAIALVVIGHYIPTTSPEYWHRINKLIYSFHMPLFFIVSGYLYGFSPPAFHSYANHLKNKAKRLLIPFISISILYLVIKIVAGLFFKLKFPVSINSLISIFINPLDSYLPLLWFVYSLFIIFAIFPLFCYSVNYNLVLLGILVMLLYLLGLKTKIFCLDLVFYNLPAFTFGFIVSFLNIDIDNIKPYQLKIIGIISIMLFVTTYLFKNTGAINDLYVDFLIYLFGSIACIALSISIYLANLTITRYLKIMGIFSMGIYLLHTMFSGIVGIIFSQVIRGDNLMFFCGAAIAISIGIILPIILEKYILRKYKITKKLFLGLG
jgi:fucose 4-O-acetylase-like acetyltransferase